MFLLIASFFAGVLTSLAPCILPLLPVIVGSSILTDGDAKQDRRKPYIISASLAVSVVLFTLLLKATSLLIGIDPAVWTVLAGVIVIVLGVVMLFPNWWVQLSASIGFEHGSNEMLAKANKHRGVTGSILTGAALGPVFSSCSPVYALVLATVLPVNIVLGMTYMVAYALGLGLALLAIALLGRRLTTRLGWAVNPNGWFRRGLAVVLILVGLLVAFGYNDRIQTWAADHLPFATTNIEENLIRSQSEKSTQGPQMVSDPSGILNVTPYSAPEFTGIVDWINTKPLTMAELRGKVVLIDFWTYSCINCQRTQPYLNAWYDKYHDKGLVIVGVHAPEFAFEKVPDNVRHAVTEENIAYPVALDNDFKTWRAYQNQFWPAKYLIDKNGMVRYTKFGEGDYDQTERAIQKLLSASGDEVSGSVRADSGSVHAGQTPETYLGYSRGERFANVDQFFNDKIIDYHLANTLQQDEWSLGGLWRIGDMQSKALDDTSNVLRIKFAAKEVYLVMDGPAGATATLRLNGQTVTASQHGGSDVATDGTVHLDGPRLYRLIDLPNFKTNQVLDIHVTKGVTINAFTFGG